MQRWQIAILSFKEKCFFCTLGVVTSWENIARNTGNLKEV